MASIKKFFRRFQKCKEDTKLEEFMDFNIDDKESVSGGNFGFFTPATTTTTHSGTEHPRIGTATTTISRNERNHNQNARNKNASSAKPSQYNAETDYWRLEMAQESAAFIKARLPASAPLPEIGVVCGSGCGAVAEAVENPVSLSFGEIPHFLSTTVPGHKGVLLIGSLAGKCVVLMQGRFHPYEGHHYGHSALPIRVMKLLGASRVILTMAAGGLNPDFKLGDLIVIKDHISLPLLSGNSPLRGPNDDRMGPRFVAQNNAYDREWRKSVKALASRLGFDSFVREGNFVQVSGPQYETPAEWRFLRMIGGDCLCMSEGHECLVARHLDMKVLAIALVTNECHMDTDDEQVVNHAEVLEIGEKRAIDLKTLIAEIMKDLNISCQC